MKREDLNFIFVKVLVYGNGRDYSTERVVCIYDDKKRIKNRALGNITGGDIQRREIAVTLNTFNTRKERDDK